MTADEAACEALYTVVSDEPPPAVPGEALLAAVSRAIQAAEYHLSVDDAEAAATMGGVVERLLRSWGAESLRGDVRGRRLLVRWRRTRSLVDPPLAAYEGVITNFAYVYLVEASEAARAAGGQQ